MSLSELVGSVLMFGLRGGTLNDPETREDVAMLKGVKAGGVLLFDHDIPGNHPRNVYNPDQLTTLIRDLRHELGPELIVAIDQEGGQVSRLSEERGFAPSVSARDFAQYEFIDQVQEAQRQARQLSTLGINLNFAPCVDLEIEPLSTIIGGKDRAFGETAQQVLACARVVVAAHQEFGVRCCLKHFPGHGSSLLDTHKNMCDITATQTPGELEVYETLIGELGDAVAVMCGHLVHKDIDKNRPASLSPMHVTGVLRERMGFGGVVVTDSLDMRAIRENFGEGEAAVMAIKAGCDLLVDGINAPGYREEGAPVRVADAIAKAIGQGEIPDAEQKLSQSRDRLRAFMGF